MWVRGLKHEKVFASLQLHKVAPYVGAWIETHSIPFIRLNYQSHPMWVRGLKLPTLRLRSQAHRSHPMWVRGLKLHTGGMVEAQ